MHSSENARNAATRTTTFIAATCYNRPQHLARMLDSIAAAEEHQNWKVAISIEPSDVLDDVLAVISNWQSRIPLVSRINSQKKGVRRNPFDNIEWCIQQGAETILLLEDDLQIDRFALRWCRLVASNGLSEPSVMCANLLFTTCCSNSIFVPEEDAWSTLSPMVLRTRFFTSYGLLFSRDQWQRHFRKNWFCDEPRMETWTGDIGEGWDLAMNRQLLMNAELEVLQSLVPRVLHDGAGGTHVTESIQATSFGNVTIDRSGQYPFETLTVVSPSTEIEQIPNRAARMYIHLCRQLWQLQTHSLRVRHAFDGFTFNKGLKFSIGKREWFLLRKKKKSRLPHNSEKDLSE